MRRSSWPQKNKSPVYKVMATLSERQLQIIDRHFQHATPDAKQRVPQWTNASSMFDPATDRLHVHKQYPSKSGYQEHVFEGARSCTNALTSSHPLKMWDHRRFATPREVARLQGFPDTFVLPSLGFTDLFGNATAVPVAACACAALGDTPRTMVDMCAGIGGMHLAAQLAFPGIRCVGFSEVKPSAVACYQANFPKVPSLGDAHTARWPRAELVTAGFPCQPFSRSMHIKGVHRHLNFFEIVLQAIDGTGAKYAVFENVTALLARGAEQFEALCEALHTRGFHTTYAVLNAADFGLPQTRRRVYIVANKRSVPEFAPRTPMKRVTLGNILQSSEEIAQA